MPVPVPALGEAGHHIQHNWINPVVRSQLMMAGINCKPRNLAGGSTLMASFDSSMFCGLPVYVSAEPMLLLQAKVNRK